MTLTSPQQVELGVAIGALTAANSAYDAIPGPISGVGLTQDQLRYAGQSIVPILQAHRDLFFNCAEQLFTADTATARDAANSITSNVDRQRQITALADAPIARRQTIDLFCRGELSAPMARQVAGAALDIFNDAEALIS